MSADLLRRAAAKLREHATAATPGPWEHVDHGESGTFMGCGSVMSWGKGVEGANIAGPSGDCYPRGGYSPLEDMSLIALMHPPVALALADLLDDVAGYYEAVPEAGRHSDPVAAVARAVLREKVPS